MSFNYKESWLYLGQLIEFKIANLVLVFKNLVKHF